jgi:ubiquinone/menaquinone biosynthesis C-methylase UbiE
MPDRESALKKYREGRARTVYDGARAASVEDPRWQEIFNKYIHFRQQCVARLALKPGETVLDVGCGTGLSFTDLESRVGAEGRIIGIEQSAEQLAGARALTERSGWQNITLINSPVEDARIPVTADAALFSFTHDIMRTPRAVENVVKSLKPGGRIVAMGGKWAPWWALATNWRTWRGVRNFITTFEGFARPWSHLERLVSSIEVESLIHPMPPVGRAGMYVAVARK